VRKIIIKSGITQQNNKMRKTKIDANFFRALSRRLKIAFVNDFFEARTINIF
jgi:hypothetical protein